MDPSAGGAPPGGAGGAPAGAGGAPGGAPGGFAGPPNPDFIPFPPTEHAKQIALVCAVVGIILNVFSFTVFSARVYTRTRPVLRLAWDDYTISLAYLMILVHSIFLLMTTPYSFGAMDPEDFKLSNVITANKYALVSQPLWAWSMALIKISVAIMLLRLEPAKMMRNFLYFMIFIQIATAVYNTVVQAVQCFPFEAAWDILKLNYPDAVCLDRTVIGMHQIIIASINVATDVAFALLPISFLRKVQRPLRERIIIGILMALGLFAAVCSIMKAVEAARFGRTDDPNAEGITIGTWSLVEEQVAFIAACVPCLRSLFQSFITKMGLATTKRTGVTKPTGAASGPSHRGFTGMSGSGGAIRLKSLSSGDSPSEENILHNETKPGIWRTTEVKMEEEDDDYKRDMMRRKASRDRDMV